MKEKIRSFAVRAEDEYISGLFVRTEEEIRLSKSEYAVDKVMGSFRPYERFHAVYRERSAERMFDINQPTIKINNTDYGVIGSILRSLIVEGSVEPTVYDTSIVKPKLYIYTVGGGDFIFALLEEYKWKGHLIGYGEMVDGRFCIFDNEGKMVFGKMIILKMHYNYQHSADKMNANRMSEKKHPITTESVATAVFNSVQNNANIDVYSDTEKLQVFGTVKNVIFEKEGCTFYVLADTDCSNDNFVISGCYEYDSETGEVDLKFLYIRSCDSDEEMKMSEISGKITFVKSVGSINTERISKAIHDLAAQAKPLLEEINKPKDHNWERQKAIRNPRALPKFVQPRGKRRR